MFAHLSDSLVFLIHHAPPPQISTNKSGFLFRVCFPFEEMDKNRLWQNGSHQVKTQRAIVAVGRGVAAQEKGFHADT